MLECGKENIMDRVSYDKYIECFNKQDVIVFEDYFCFDMYMMNGVLEFIGIDGMKDYYINKIWFYFVEDLMVFWFFGGEEWIVIEMIVEFKVIDVFDEILFGVVEKGEWFMFYGLLMYELEGGCFKKI